MNNKWGQKHHVVVVDGGIVFFKIIGCVLLKPNVEFPLSGEMAVVQILANVNDRIFFTWQKCAENFYNGWLNPFVQWWRNIFINPQNVDWKLKHIKVVGKSVEIIWAVGKFNTVKYVRFGFKDVSIVATSFKYVRLLGGHIVCWCLFRWVNDSVLQRWFHPIKTAHEVFCALPFSSILHPMKNLIWAWWADIRWLYS